MRNNPFFSRLCRVAALPIAALCCLLLAGCVVPKPPELDYARYSSESHTDFGLAYEEEGDLVRARRQYERAVKRDPANYVAWTNLGNLHARFSEYEAAREAYRHALALRPGYGPAVNNLAMTYLDDEPPDPRLARKILEAHLPLVSTNDLPAVRGTLESIPGE